MSNGWRSAVTSDCEYIDGLLRAGTTEQLEELAELIDDFPNGKDEFVGQPWIHNAIDVGSKRTIAWMLSRKVDLAASYDDAGVPILLRAIEAERSDVLELLLQHGAPVDVHGINDWTPLHMAAAKNDVAAVKLLLQYGADPTAKTRIDDYATPLEEARTLGANDAVRYLESII